MKKLLFGFVFLFNFLVNAAEHNQESPVTSLLAKIVSYDEEIVKQFHAIMYKFHEKDLETNAGEFKAIFEQKLANRVQSFKDKKSSLLLIYKNTTIVGGTYFFTEGEEKVVLLGGTSFDSSALNILEITLAMGNIIQILSSDFVGGTSIVFFLPKDSDKIGLVNLLGFKESDYPLPTEFPKTHFSAFEKAIK